MGSRIRALAVLALACLVAAGGGAYLAVRQGQAAPEQAPVSTPVTDTQVPADALGAPVGIVTTPPASDLGPVAEKPARVRSDGPPADPATSVRTSSRRPERQAAPPSGQAEGGSTPAGDQPLPAARPTTNGAAEAQASAALTLPAPVPPVPAAELQREFLEVTVPADSVLGLQVQTAVSSETAKVEDPVEARVTRDVRVNDRIAIPAGSQVQGSVVQVDRGGKVRERAHFAVRFHTLILPDGSRTSLTAEALYREGPSPARKSAAKIGGAAAGGAILGAILGGGKGAAIGSGIGAAGGTAATMAGERQPATLAAGSMVNVRLMQPVVVTLER